MCGRFTHRLTWEQVHGLYTQLQKGGVRLAEIPGGICGSQ